MKSFRASLLLLCIFSSTLEYVTATTLTEADCTNDGTINALYQSSKYPGCSCPPGFLGQNCRPAKCLGGNSASFYSKAADQSVHFVIYGTNDFYEKALVSDGQDVFDKWCGTLTEKYDGTVIINVNDFAEFPISPSDDGKTKCTGYFDSVLKNHLGNSNFVFNLETLRKELQGMLPNSQLFIFTDIEPIIDSEQLKNVIRYAISRRITIHFVVFAPEPDVILPSQYDTLPSFAALRQIADATMGSFVTPYFTGENWPMSENTATDVFNQLFSLYKDGFIQIAQVTSSFPSNFNTLQAGDHYITYRNLKPSANDYVPFKTIPTLIPQFVLQTGSWKMIKLTTTATTRYSLFEDIPITFLFKSPIRAYLATSNDLTVDAATPYGLAETDLILVAHTESDSKTTIKTVEAAERYGQLASAVEPRACQFETVLGRINCARIGETVVQFTITTNDKYAQQFAVPFYCAVGANIGLHAPELIAWADEDAETVTTILGDASTTGQHDLTTALVGSTTELQDLTTTGLDAQTTGLPQTTTTYNGPQCVNKYENEGLQEPAFGGRQFTFIVRNYKNTFYPIVIQGYQLTNLLTSFTKNNPGYYKYFSYGIIPRQDLSYGGTDVNAFLTSLTNVKSDDTADFDAKPVDLVQYMKDTFTTAVIVNETARYSDFLIVVDFAITNKDNLFDKALLDVLFNYGIRIYFVLLKNDNDDFSSTYPKYMDLAVRTGGHAFIVNSTDDVVAFYSNYFDHIVGGDVVSQNFNFASSIRYTFPLANYRASNYTLIIASNNLLSITRASLAGVDITELTEQSNSGTLIFYDFEWSDSTSSAALLLNFAPTVYPSSVTLLDRNPLNPVVLRFTDNMDNEVDDSRQFRFNSPKSQYPVVGGNATSTTVTLLNYNGNSASITSFYSNETIEREECTYFSGFLQYNFLCWPANAVYFVQTDSVDDDGNEQSRTQILTCAAEDGVKCYAGGTWNNVNGKCDCPVGFEGDYCQYTECQNGGTRGDDNTCNCLDDFEGDSCQDYSGVCKEVTVYDDLASLDTLTILLDSEFARVDEVVDFTSLQQGTQITVVQYDKTSNTYSLVMSGADSTRVSASLVKFSANAVEGSPADALVYALRSQLTGRGLLVWISDGQTTLEDDDKAKIQNVLSSQRTDIRVATVAKAVSDDIKFVATLGNGIPYLTNDKTDLYTNYLTKYVVALLKDSEKILNVVSTSSDCSAPYEIPTDEGDIVYIHSTTKPKCNGGDDSQKLTAGTTVNVYTCSSSTGSVKVEFSSDTSCSYSIETVSQYKIAYGFSKDNNNGVVNNGFINGTNYISVNTKEKDENTIIQLNAISADGSVASSGSSYVMFIRTNKSCSYNRYTQFPVDDAAVAYRMLITSGKHQVQVVTPVFRASNESDCFGREFDDGVCTCDATERNVDCSQPICSSGGVAGYGVCFCPPGYSGRDCKGFSERAVYAFILDTAGQDQKLRNDSLDGISAAISNFDLSRIRIMFITNANTSNEDFKTYSSMADVNTTLYEHQFDFNIIQNGSRIPSLSLTTCLDNIYNKAKSLNLPKTTNYIYYVTQVGGNDNTNRLDDLRKPPYNFAFRAIGLARDGYKLDPQAQTELDILSHGQTITANGTLGVYSAITDDFRDFQNVTTLENHDARTCVYDLNSNIYFFADLNSNNTKGAQYQQLMLLYASELSISPFGIGGDINDMKELCSMPVFDNYSIATAVNTRNPKGKTRMATFLNKYYPYACNPGFLPSVADRFVVDTRYDGPLLMDNQTVSNAASTYLVSTRCAFCNRWDQPKVGRFAVWLATNGTVIDEKLYPDYIDVAFKDLSYTHIIVKFGDFSVQDDPFYSRLLEYNKAKTDLDTVVSVGHDEASLKKAVQEIWTIQCRVRNLIDQSATAPPPSANAIEKLRRMFPSVFFGYA